MATPDSPDSPLIKEGSENYPQLSRSKLGKELGRSRFSHAKAEHPRALKCFIFFFVLIIVCIGAFVLDVRNGRGDYLLIYILLSSVCITGCRICVDVIILTITIHETDDALFFLKLIAAGYSWEEVGRIMNSYLFQKGLWWTNSFFYDGQHCYNIFVRYSKRCTDPVIQVFIEQAKHKLAESVAQQWDRIGLSGV
ncbi:hypothetical conserved protein [Kluyveromyces marxianus]|nr:hypothetical conserved protein [Kluyveromyces marxianus]